jgi:hypothetical protein
MHPLFQECVRGDQPISGKSQVCAVVDDEEPVFDRLGCEGRRVQDPVLGWELDSSRSPGFHGL